MKNAESSILKIGSIFLKEYFAEKGDSTGDNL